MRFAFGLTLTALILTSPIQAKPSAYSISDLEKRAQSVGITADFANTLNQMKALGKTSVPVESFAKRFSSKDGRFTCHFVRKSLAIDEGPEWCIAKCPTWNREFTLGIEVPIASSNNSPQIGNDGTVAFITRQYPYGTAHVIALNGDEIVSYPTEPNSQVEIDRLLLSGNGRYLSFSVLRAGTPPKTMFVDLESRKQAEVSHRLVYRIADNGEVKVKGKSFSLTELLK